MTFVPHPLYSPDPPPSDFFLFPKVFKGKCFALVEGVKQKTAETLKGIKINNFKNCFEQWKKHLNKCIESNREYFEGE